MAPRVVRPARRRWGCRCCAAPAGLDPGADQGVQRLAACPLPLPGWLRQAAVPAAAVQFRSPLAAAKPRREWRPGPAGWRRFLTWAAERCSWWPCARIRSRACCNSAAQNLRCRQTLALGGSGSYWGRLKNAGQRSTAGRWPLSGAGAVGPWKLVTWRFGLSRRDRRTGR